MSGIAFIVNQLMPLDGRVLMSDPKIFTRRPKVDLSSQKDKILKSLNSGWDYRQLATQYGVSDSSMRRFLQRQGVPLKLRKRHTKNERSIAVMKIKSGKISVKDLASQMQVSDATIYTWLKEEGC